jgi:uncharacterized protein (DUF1697 family)
MRYIALLRAVNVGGRKVEMARLRAATEAAGFEGVKTYIASGNLFFDAPRQAKAKLVERLEAALGDEFGFEIPVILRTLTELEAVCAGDPFAGVEVTDDVRLQVLFLASPPPPLELALPATSPKGGYELVGLTAGEAYVVVRLQNGRWPSDTWLDKLIGVPATGRFWHTTAKILEAAR